ncbi:hypothetical protein GYA13_00695 [Candidatus Kuenenbacteria bacterium]|nr:hypothetical protein [Candidatus Kuenenbacteria bacterium]
MSLILNKIKKEAVVFCPLCNKDYTPRDLKVIEEAGETILAHSSCPACRGAILSLLYKDMLGITLLGLATDLDYNDALRLKDGEPVEPDEVLWLYQFLAH